MSFRAPLPLSVSSLYFDFPPLYSPLHSTATDLPSLFGDLPYGIAIPPFHLLASRSVIPSLCLPGSHSRLDSGADRAGAAACFKEGLVTLKLLRLPGPTLGPVTRAVSHRDSSTSARLLKAAGPRVVLAERLLSADRPPCLLRSHGGLVTTTVSRAAIVGASMRGRASASPLGEQLLVCQGCRVRVVRGCGPFPLPRVIVR